MLGAADRARRAHERALEVDPGDARTWLNLGNALLMERDVQHALRAYRRAVTLDSAYAPGWVSLGSACERAGRPDAAVAAYRRGARLDTAYAPFVRERLKALGGGHGQAE